MKYVIQGKNKLFGSVDIQGAKNSVLCLMACSVLARSKVTISRVPIIDDVVCMIDILRGLGAKVECSFGNCTIDPTTINSNVVPADLSNKLRASIFLVGALLARFKSVTFSQSGGCDIGSRPIDIHLRGFSALGAVCNENDGVLQLSASKLVGTTIKLAYPSVGATENLIMASALASGVTVLHNCAKEPEIVDLANFINLMGGKVSGAGTDCIVIEGVRELVGVEYKPIADRIETGTFLLAVACCGGELQINGINPENICALTEKLRYNACKIYANNDIIYIIVNNILYGFGDIVTGPYPLFATDLQPLIVACACGCLTSTTVTETVFENRFKYCAQLQKLGANIAVNNNSVTVYPSKLVGGKVYAPDLRGGASLCLGALMAEGETEIYNIDYIDRGYENFEQKLTSLGARIKRN